jgi:DNA-binding transcriptional MocR family regulator
MPHFALACSRIHSPPAALVSQLARSGGAICLDALAYLDIKAIAAQLRVRLQALPRDDEGPHAHAFVIANVKAIQATPTCLGTFSG